MPGVHSPKYICGGVYLNKMNFKDIVIALMESLNCKRLEIDDERERDSLKVYICHHSLLTRCVPPSRW